ncbi:MAG: hypothetical protein JSS27_08345 [Planctomycetes bacterium]|nr:hypothetical protein [Planctomycetota bacterium]
MLPSNDAWSQLLQSKHASPWLTDVYLRGLRRRAVELGLARAQVTLGETFGNRFLLVWQQTGVADQSAAERSFWSEVAQQVCQRGLRVDDTLHVAPAQRGPDHHFWVVGGDGRVATHCANGLLLAGWLVATRDNLSRLVFHCGAESRQIELLSERLARVNLGVPRMLPRSSSLPASLLSAPSAIHTGEPHAVSFVEELAIAEPPYHDRCLEIGREVCDASPDGGINWNLVAVERGQLHIRTFERGVRRITRSCGTGSAAAFTVALLRGKLKQRQALVSSAGGTHMVAMKGGEVFLGGRPRVERHLTLEQLLHDAGRKPLAKS